MLVAREYHGLRREGGEGGRGGREGGKEGGRERGEGKRFKK